MGKLSYRKIIVDGTPAGLQGLDELFALLYSEGRRPDETTLNDDVITRVKKHNYIPPSAKQAFAEALVSAYRSYVIQRDAGETPQRVDYGTWQGIPREQIPWFPNIDADLCNGCGLCLKLCSPHALIATDKNKVQVGDPFKCVVGCSSCATICKPKAITFPPRAMLKTFQRRR